MKNSIYVIAILALTFFSCSVDEAVTEETNIIESVEDQLKSIPMDAGVCQRFKLKTNDTGVGYVDISFDNNDIIMTYKIIDDFYLSEAKLAVIDQEGEIFPLSNYIGEPAPEQFEYSKFPTSLGKEVTFVVPQQYYLAEYDFAAYAIVINKENMKESEAWSDGEYFSSNSSATYSSINVRKCVN